MMPAISDPAPLVACVSDLHMSCDRPLVRFWINRLVSGETIIFFADRCLQHSFIENGTGVIIARFLAHHGLIQALERAAKPLGCHRGIFPIN